MIERPPIELPPLTDEEQKAFADTPWIKPRRRAFAYFDAFICGMILVLLGVALGVWVAGL